MKFFSNPNNDPEADDLTDVSAVTDDGPTIAHTPNSKTDTAPKPAATVTIPVRKPMMPT